MFSLIMPILASAIIITSPVSPQITKVERSEMPSFVFTKALPINNYVAYNIQSSDTLKSIARKIYNDEAYWANLWNDNSWIEDPYSLEDVGMIKINIAKSQAAQQLQKNLKTKLSKAEAKRYYRSAYAVVQVSSPATDYESVYKTAGEKFGVPWQILYGLHMTETGGRNGYILNHGGSGAQGPMQFMPGTWRAYGVDGDGDGVADINNAIDAIYGAANYLVKHGTLESGLRAYGGNYTGTLAHARNRGYTP